MTTRILCVDDEPRVLDGLETLLEWDYEVTTATSGADGLQLLRAAEADGNPFAVVISDMRMPGMDGATFLSSVRASHPMITRMLLTGYTDLESAMRAVNSGKIFRMLLKPCPQDALLEAVSDAFSQHRLMRAEKDLLEATLRGAVQALFDALGLASPYAFSRATALRRYVAFVVDAWCPFDDKWMFEIAAMFSLLGYISIPADLIEKKRYGRPLEPAESEMVAKYPELSYQLAHRIPRLENVAEIARAHLKPWDVPDKNGPVYYGASLIYTALLLDSHIIRGASVKSACDALAADHHTPPRAVEILRGYVPPHAGATPRAVNIDALEPAMTLDSDILSHGGQLLVKKGQEITHALILRLRNFHKNVGVTQPIRVLIKR